MFSEIPAPNNASNFGTNFTEEDFGLVVQCGFKVTVLARDEKLIYVNDNRYCRFTDVKKVIVNAVDSESIDTQNHFEVILVISYWNHLWIATEKRREDAYALADRITLFLGPTIDGKKRDPVARERRSMLVIVFIALFICVYFAFKPVLAFSDRSRYSLAKVDVKPIPKRAAFTLWQDVAFEKCANSQKNMNIAPGECRKIVKDKHSICSVASSGAAPDTITETVQAKALGSAYLQCVIPNYSCNGVEVRTEEEAKTQCE